MYQQDHILNELQLLSPTLAAIPRVNVFKVPEGYFDILSSQLLSQIHKVDLNIRPFPGVSVPEGYFENLSDTIMARIKKEYSSEALQETRGISELVAGIGNKNIYNVPEGYFEGLSQSIIEHRKYSLLSDVAGETSNISGLVAGIGNKNVYKVPQGYFDGLSQAIIDYRKNNLPSDVAQETRNISELVADIGIKNIYRVPDGYFDEIADEISNRLNKPAKVVYMKRHFSTFRYAAAAVVTGLIGLSLFFILNKKDDTQPSGQTAALMSEARQIIKTNSFEKELSSVTDAAIVSFLESKGQDVEAALVASLADEKNLPDAADYLINENTLDDVLKTLDLNN